MEIVSQVQVRKSEMVQLVIRTKIKVVIDGGKSYSREISKNKFGEFISSGPRPMRTF